MSTSAEHDVENTAPAEPATPVRRAGRGTRLAMLFLRGRTLIVLIVLVIMFSLISGDYLTTSNLLLMSKHVSITGLMAIGVTFVILTGGIDLSVGSVAGLAGMIAGGLLYEGLKLPGGDTLWFSAVMVVVIAVLVGAVVGAINGLLVTKLKVAPFIATLGVLYAARGLADLRSNGATFPNLAGTPARHNTGFATLGIKSWLGVPVAIWIMVLVAAVAILVTTRTPFGRRVYAVGGNERAAELAGIRTSRVKIATYVISGACAALAGLILTSELGAAYPDTATTYELNAIAAAVLGGTSLTGGKGTIIGTILGALVIGFLSDGLVLVGVSSFWQLVIKGTVIVLAVVMEQTQERVKARMTT
jgi:erythritol transport system permease protein